MRPANHAVLPWVLAAATVCAAPAQAKDAPASTEAQALHRLLDAAWEWRLSQFPERATQLGDHRYDDRLTDRSPAAIAARRAHHREELAAIRAIDQTRLAGEDRLSWEVLAFNAKLEVRGDDLLRSPGRDLPFSSDDSPFEVNQVSGPQFNLPQLARATRFANEADYRHFLARLQALPAALAQSRAILEAGRGAGWMPPQVALARLPSQFAALLNTDLTHHPLYAPFQKLPADLSPATQTELADTATRTLHDVVIPALQAFRDYLATTYVPAAEIDRYLVWPGQATAYKVGEQRILALREKAKAALGSRFDLRRFHNAVLDHGALPLAVLDRSIAEWIEAEQSRREP